MDEIKVYVVKKPDRRNLLMRYVDPLTGKQVTRSTETSKQREAERKAAVWQDELNSGRYQKRCRMSWDEFRNKFYREVQEHQKPSTTRNTDSTLNVFEDLTHRNYLADLTTARVALFTQELRKPYTITRGQGKRQTSREAIRSEASVARHLRHLKVVARWAHRQGLLLKLPAFDMPKKSSGAIRAKGRAIVAEEFDRMLAATPKVVGETAAESWLLLRGLWASGLRLGEAMNLRWDRQPGGVSVLLNGHKSVLAFGAGSQKNGKVQLVPLAPEAVKLLQPIQRSAGFVFTPQRADGQPLRRDKDLVSKTICEIGRTAGVIVDAERGKFASAHDLRRAFGNRWSRRVMPPVLKDLMRHADVATTMTYYAQQGAETTAAELWRVLGDSLGDSQDARSEKHRENQYTPQESNL